MCGKSPGSKSMGASKTVSPAGERPHQPRDIFLLILWSLAGLPSG